MVKKGENIYKRKDGRWEGRYIKQRTATNKIMYGYIYGKRYGDVKEKLIILRAKQLTKPSHFESYSGVYKDWIAKWLDEKAKRNVKATTYSNYLRLIKRHIIPQLGKYRLHQIKPETIQAFVDSLSERGLSSGSIRLIINIVKQSLKEAKKKKYLLTNPCDHVEIPKQQPTIVHALSMKEQRALETIAFADTNCSPILLALYTGMRIGEISGLRWENIDFDQGLIQVERTVSRITDESSVEKRTKLITGSPKTLQSIRVIPIAENLQEYLLEKKQETVSEYLIHNRHGDLAEPRLINYRFKKAICGTSFEKIHFHMLRHTFATRCLEQGVDIASLSRLLGHKSTKLTLDTYADSIFERRKEVIKAIDVLFKQE